jgi:hypothetical protein
MERKKYVESNMKKILKEKEIQRRKRERELEDARVAKALLEKEREARVRLQKSDEEFAQKLREEEREHKIKAERDEKITEFMVMTNMMDKAQAESLLVATNFNLQEAFHKFLDVSNVVIKFFFKEKNETKEKTFHKDADAWDLLSYLNENYPAPAGKMYIIKNESETQTFTIETLSQYRLSDLNIVNQTKLIISLQ